MTETTDLLPPVHRYQRRPEASRIEAVQFDGTGDMASQILHWANSDLISAHVGNVAASPDDTDWTITIRENDTKMVAKRGDWVAKGALGQVYAVPDEIMAATYEPADSE